jgi:hypothetical protein
MLTDAVGYILRRLADIDHLFVFVGEFVDAGQRVASTLRRGSASSRRQRALIGTLALVAEFAQ